MCDCNVACFETVPAVKYRKLTLLLLDCWQREYDKRPYRKFKFELLDFVGRMKRNYDPVKDFAVIINFIANRKLCSVTLSSLRVLAKERDLICDFVESLNKLRRIELRLMSLPTDFFKAIEENVQNMNVQELVLTGTLLRDDDVLCLRSFLIASDTLARLNVAACSVNQYNFAYLADGVHKSCSMVAFNASRLVGKHLSLDTEKIAMVTSSLIWQNQLEELVLTKCEFNAQDMEIIAEYLYNKSSRLMKLNVSYNKIGPDGARYLLQAISRSGTLKHLHMSGCGLGTHGGEYVAKFLSSCRYLKSLHITFNDIGAKASTLILLTLKKPLNITKICLWGNKYNPRTGYILRRLIESRVLPQDNIDISYTFDDTIPGFRVIPWKP